MNGNVRRMCEAHSLKIIDHQYLFHLILYTIFETISRWRCVKKRIYRTNQNHLYAVNGFAFETYLQPIDLYSAHTSIVYAKFTAYYQ